MGQIKSSEIAADESGRQYHIACAPGEVAEKVILVGDPDRARRVSKMMESVKFETSHREYVTFTGTYKGVEITVMGTGIGTDNTEIAVIEICKITKSPSFIRCGTCGALQERIDVGDMVLTQGAVKLESTSSYFVHEGYPAVADPVLLTALSAACTKLGLKHHVGITATACGFYGPQGRNIEGFPVRRPDLWKELSTQGVLNFEMESSTLYSLATLRGVRAATICTAVANRVKGTWIDKDRQPVAEKECLTAGLEAFVLFDRMEREMRDKGTPLWVPSELLS